MVMRYWGERGVDAESFQSLVDPKAGGIRTDVLASNLRGRSWNATALEGSSDTVAQELRQGRPVIALLEDRPREDGCRRFRLIAHGAFGLSEGRTMACPDGAGVWRLAEDRRVSQR